MNIAIIEAGDLGQELATLWSKKGHRITTTTRSPEQFPLLSRVSQKCLLFSENDFGELATIITNNDIIVIMASIDLTEQFEEIALQIAQTIRRSALDHTHYPRRLIFTSSTSVYGDHRGMWVDENGKLKNSSEQGLFLMEAERTALSTKELGWNVCLLRVAEIYGPKRALSLRLTGPQREFEVHSCDHFSNMVHRYDVVSAIDYALRRRLEGVYNVADDDHPTRKDLYEKVVTQHNLPTIQWQTAKTTWRGGNRRISNYKIKGKGFTFKYPHRLLD